MEATFAFIDLAGFSALTEVHGDEQAAALLDRFEQMSRAALGSEDRLVKMIGDAAMIRFANPRGAVSGVKRLIDACMNEADFPIPRAGLHHGAAIERSGDFVGHAVNVAARVAGQASGGQTLATTFVATAARAMHLNIVDLGCYELRNLSARVELFEIELHTATYSTAIDPVCRMQVARSKAAGHVRHADVEYLFCSLSCVASFAADPEHYAHGHFGI